MFSKKPHPSSGRTSLRFPSGQGEDGGRGDAPARRGHAGGRRAEERGDVWNEGGDAVWWFTF